MWDDLSRRSGVPFLQHHRSPSGVVDAELYVDRSRPITSSLAVDFQRLANANNNEEETQRLQQSLLQVTNHAAAVEIEAGKERENNRVLTQTVTCLQDEITSLRRTLHDQEHCNHSLQEQSSANKKEIKSLRCHLKEIESRLETRKATEEQLRLEHSKTLDELNESKEKISAFAERVASLKANINDTIQASKERERKAIATAQAEAGHDTAILEEKLRSTEQQLDKQSTLAKEARQETSDVRQQLHDNIETNRKEISALHSTEVEQARKIERITAELSELQHANATLAEQSDKSSSKVDEAENRVKELNDEVQNQAARCDCLRAELDQVR